MQYNGQDTTAMLPGAKPGGRPVLTRDRDPHTDFFPMKMHLVFTMCSIAVLFCGVVGFINNLFAFQFTLFELITNVYLILFAIFMFVLDAPLNFVLFTDVRAMVFKWARALTRFTGRGIWYTFLGSLVWAKLFTDDRGPFLGFFLGGAVTVVGILTLVMGILKSKKLEKVRKALKAQQERGQLAAIFTSHAVQSSDGMKKEEFNAMCADLQVHPAFSSTDLEYIFAALAIANAEALQSDDLEDFVCGPMVFL